MLAQGLGDIQSVTVTGTRCFLIKCGLRARGFKAVIAQFGTQLLLESSQLQNFRVLGFQEVGLYFTVVGFKAGWFPSG